MSTDTQFDMLGGQTRYGAFTDFLGIGGAITSGVNTHDFVTGVTENSGTASTLVAKEGGLFTLATGTSSGNRSMIYSDSNYLVSNGPLIMEARVTFHTAATNVQGFVGFGDLNTINQPLYIDSGVAISAGATANAVGFIFSTAATNTTNWYLAGYKASAATTAVLTSNFAPVADTFQTLRVEIARDGAAYFFINGTQVGASSGAQFPDQTGMLNSVATTALLSPMVACKTKTTAAKTMYVDYVYVQGGRNT